MNAGDKASPTPYLLRLTGKPVFESIWDHIITIQVRNTKYYEGNRVPLPVTLLKTIKKTNYISEGPDITYLTAQKRITLLGVALLDEDEI